jgi:hypothetical protein
MKMKDFAAAVKNKPNQTQFIVSLSNLPVVSLSNLPVVSLSNLFYPLQADLSAPGGLGFFSYFYLAFGGFYSKYLIETR